MSQNRQLLQGQTSESESTEFIFRGAAPQRIVDRRSQTERQVWCWMQFDADGPSARGNVTTFDSIAASGGARWAAFVRSTAAGLLALQHLTHHQ